MIDPGVVPAMLLSLSQLPCTPRPLDGTAAPPLDRIRLSDRATVVAAPPGIAAPGRFGVAVAIDDQRLFIGCDGLRDGPAVAGRVFGFQAAPNGDWVLDAEILPTRSTPGDRFGATLDLEGDRLVVGAPGGTGGRGGGWLVELEPGSVVPRVVLGLPLPDPRRGDRFGESIAIAGDLVLVGAPRADVDGRFDRGRVAAIRLDEPGEPDEIHPPISATGLRFGWAVEAGEHAFIGAPGMDAPSLEGSIDRAGGVLVHAIEPPFEHLRTRHLGAPRPLERFGSSMAVDGDVVAAGAPRAFVDDVRAGVIGILSPRPLELAGTSASDLGFGDRVGMSSGSFAASMPGRREDGRLEPAVRIGRVENGNLRPIADLLIEAGGRVPATVAFDPLGHTLAIGLPDPGIDDGATLEGIVQVIDSWWLPGVVPAP